MKRIIAVQLHEGADRERQEVEQIRAEAVRQAGRWGHVGVQYEQGDLVLPDRPKAGLPEAREETAWLERAARRTEQDRISRRDLRNSTWTSARPAGAARSLSQEEIAALAYVPPRQGWRTKKS